jgi:magnesium-protoporphyrin O-methyltransferase
MPTASFSERRSRIEHYFDRTALDTWKQLTSDAPVSRIRATVRAGRDRMRTLLLESLPADMQGQRLLDAGCGTGALAVEAAKRGAEVVAIDISASLIEIARERAGDAAASGAIRFLAGDMLDRGLGEFDHAVCMDSLIHYEPNDMARAVASLAPRVRATIAFTFAPRTPALTLMHFVGRAFPRGDRAPSIVPVSESNLRRRLAAAPELHDWAPAQSTRISSGFYMSQAMVLTHHGRS